MHTAHKRMFRHFLTTAVYTVLPAALLLTCGKAGIEVTITESELQQDLQRKFPISRIYGGLAVVTLREPTLHLGRGDERLTVSLTAKVSPRALGVVDISAGRITFSSGLVFDNTSGHFLLEDVEVDAIGLELEPLDIQVQQGIKGVIRTILRERIEGTVVYRLEPGQFRTPIAKLFLRRVVIRGNAVVVTLGF